MISSALKSLRLNDSILARTLPFALFMSFIAVEEGMRMAALWGSLTFPESFSLYLYPVKTFCVAAVLGKYLRHCQELSVKDLRAPAVTLVVCTIGAATFVLWVSMDWAVTVTGAHAGFNPALFPEGPLRHIMVMIRVMGAVLVVPVMEELFWRSFLLRYLIDPDFESVPIGRFTWPSFLITTALFGFEHQLVIAGMVAGAIYNIVLYKTRSIAHCVLAHAVTNLALACYVLYTGKWYFW
jgi:uncharacterized protein